MYADERKNGEVAMTANRTEYERFEASGDDERRLLRQEELILDVTETICAVLNENKVSRSELAERLGKSRALVTQILSGDRNLTLRTLSDVAEVLGCRMRFSMIDRKPLARVIHEGPWRQSHFQIVAAESDLSDSKNFRSAGGAA